MNISLPEFTPAQESLFLTLGSRAIDSRLPRPFLGDATADEIIATIGYGLDKFPQLTTKLVDRRSKVFDVAVRTKVLDEMVRRFVRRQPDAVVLDLGAGLDGRISRVSPPPSVEWYDVDFPEVVALREQLLPQYTNAHNVGTNLTDPDWLQAIRGDRPAMIVADGLLLFLAHHEFITLLNRLIAHFPGGELALNAYTTYAVWTFKHSRAMRAIAGDVTSPGINDPRQLEHWIDGLTLLDEILLTRQPEVAELPTMGRLAFRLAARSAKLSRLLTTVVWRYGF
jgi:O-methyltransferase involved in polyketide biosynthesis